MFVNHETSLVPFPFNTASPPAIPERGEQNDFLNSQVSQLRSTSTGRACSRGSTRSRAANYQRFCSSFIGTQPRASTARCTSGTRRRRTGCTGGDAWPDRRHHAGEAGAEQAGIIAALDVQTGKVTTIYGMGRLNHENTVAIPVDEGILRATNLTNG